MVEPEDSIRTILSIPDPHGKYRDKRAFECMLLLLSIVQPNITIIHGDFLDLEQLSHWRRVRLIDIDVGGEIEIGNMMLDEIKSAHDSPEKHFLEGNHEEWLWLWVCNQGQDAAALVRTIPEVLSLKERGYTWQPYRDGAHSQREKPLKIGKVYFIHGWYTNKYHAAKTAETVGRNIIYGHSHDHQVFSKTTVEETRLAMSIGCLGNPAEAKYLRTPHNWLHGSCITYLNAQGEFSAYFVPFIKGRFRWEGKEYKV